MDALASKPRPRILGVSPSVAPSEVLGRDMHGFPRGGALDSPITSTTGGPTSYMESMSVCTLGNDVSNVHGLSEGATVFVSEQALSLGYSSIQVTTAYIVVDFFYLVIARTCCSPSSLSSASDRPQPPNGSWTALLVVDDPTPLANRGPPIVTSRLGPPMAASAAADTTRA